MAITEAQVKATKKYHQANYNFIKVRFKKDEAEKVRQMAAESGKSLNQFILDKIFDK